MDCRVATLLAMTLKGDYHHDYDKFEQGSVIHILEYVNDNLRQ